MKKHLLIPFLSLMLLCGWSVSAQEKGKSHDEKSESAKDEGYDHYEKGCYNGDWHCYRAWRKEMKRRRKEEIADEIECYRPWAAERKRRHAERKAWRRDILEHEHRSWGYWDHDWWSWGYGGYWY